MDDNNLLRDLGLNKYEASAYLTLLNEGISDANTISQRSNIPMGKVYEVLESLKNEGLVEIQDSRPKKYRSVDPKIALNNYYLKKKKDTENELDRIKETVSKAEEKLAQYTYPDYQENTFWSMIMEADEHLKFVKQLSGETKNEICVVHQYTLKSFKPSEFSEIYPSIFDYMFPLIYRGVRINVITPDSYFLTLLKQKYESISDEHLKERIESFVKVRVLDTKHGFTLIDNYMVILDVQNPLQPNKTMGLIKIYDTNFSHKLKSKFNELWKLAGKFALSGYS
ncbi:MAG: TrmB family transcriptional regulator [Methanohalobium sp.]|uniref:TrmB family transcriptional regulator n=1 Tax=Methanohalobium sp. TaxID=2837493 RepID=UPI00397AC403